MPHWRSTFDLIEAGNERGNKEAEAAAFLIDETMREAFRIMDSGRFALRPLEAIGFKLAGDDRAERVAEALAVWIKESNPLAFAEMTATRYAATTFESCGGSGFERLRSESEFILVAYPHAEATVESIRDEWQRDIESCMRPDDFDYESARMAVERFCEDNGLRIEAELAPYRDAPAEAELAEGESNSFLLYVRDMHAEAAAEREAKRQPEPALYQGGGFELTGILPNAPKPVCVVHPFATTLPCSACEESNNASA